MAFVVDSGPSGRSAQRSRFGEQACSRERSQACRAMRRSDGEGPFVDSRYSGDGSPSCECKRAICRTDRLAAQRQQFAGMGERAQPREARHLGLLRQSEVRSLVPTPIDSIVVIRAVIAALKDAPVHVVLTTGLAPAARSAAYRAMEAVQGSGRPYLRTPW